MEGKKKAKTSRRKEDAVQSSIRRENALSQSNDVSSRVLGEQLGNEPGRVKQTPELERDEVVTTGQTLPHVTKDRQQLTYHVS